MNALFTCCCYVNNGVFSHMKRLTECLETFAYSIYKLNWKRSRYHKNWENSQKARQIGFTNAHFYLAFGYLSRLKYQETVSVVSLRIRELIAITKNLSITGVLPSNFIICNTAISTKVLHHVNTYSSMRAWNLKWKIWIPSKKTTSSGDIQQKSVIQDIFFHCGRICLQFGAPWKKACWPVLVQDLWSSSSAVFKSMLVESSRLVYCRLCWRNLDTLTRQLF